MADPGMGEKSGNMSVWHLFIPESREAGKIKGSCHTGTNTKGSQLGNSETIGTSKEHLKPICSDF